MPLGLSEVVFRRAFGPLWGLWVSIKPSPCFNLSNNDFISLVESLSWFCTYSGFSSFGTTRLPRGEWLWPPVFFLFLILSLQLWASYSSVFSLQELFWPPVLLGLPLGDELCYFFYAFLSLGESVPLGLGLPLTKIVGDFDSSLGPKAWSGFWESWCLGDA